MRFIEKSVWKFGPSDENGFLEIFLENSWAQVESSGWKIEVEAVERCIWGNALGVGGGRLVNYR